MEWYDGVKQSQGFVEISSMELAKAINTAGLYVIGAFEESTSNTKRVSLALLQLFKIYVLIKSVGFLENEYELKSIIIWISIFTTNFLILISLMDKAQIYL